MSNLLEHAKTEFVILRGSDSEPDEMQDMMEKHLLQMIEVFSEEGHSGFSGEYAINCLERLLRFLPLTPLTGEDDEWVEFMEGHFQNRRCSSVFKDSQGNAHQIEAKIFSNDGGETWWTSKDSGAPVTFPYSVPTHAERVILE